MLEQLQFLVSNIISKIDSNISDEDEVYIKEMLVFLGIFIILAIFSYYLLIKEKAGGKRMEEIVEKRMKIKYVPVQTDEFEDKIIYKAIDGKTFENKDAAESYERGLKEAKSKEIYPKIEKVKTDIYLDDSLDDIWYRPKTQEEIDALVYYFSRGDSRVHDVKFVKPGNWVRVDYDYDDDRDVSNYYFINLEQTLKDIEHERDYLLENSEKLKELLNGNV